jgi:hypothetical protein
MFGGSSNCDCQVKVWQEVPSGGSTPSSGDSTADLDPYVNVGAGLTVTVNWTSNPSNLDAKANQLIYVSSSLGNCWYNLDSVTGGGTMAGTFTLRNLGYNSTIAAGLTISDGVAYIFNGKGYPLKVNTNDSYRINLDATNWSATTTAGISTLTQITSEVTPVYWTHTSTSGPPVNLTVDNLIPTRFFPTTAKWYTAILGFSAIQIGGVEYISKTYISFFIGPTGLISDINVNTTGIVTSLAVTGLTITSPAAYTLRASFTVTDVDLEGAVIISDIHRIN